MNEAYRRCCGIDIHKDTVVVCVLPLAGSDGQTVRKTYGTFRNDLIRMRVWLKQLKVTARRGWAKAIVATSHKILVIAFQVLKTNTPYIELGGDYFDRLNPLRTARKLVQRLEALGHQVQLSPIMGSNP